MRQTSFKPSILTKMVAILWFSFSLTNLLAQTLPIKQWDKTVGGNYKDYLNSLQQTADGGYILGGSSASNAGGDKSADSKGVFDYWVVKLDATGNKEWEKTIGGDGEDVLHAIRQTADGGYILGGSSTSNASGDKSEDSKGYSYNGEDYWVIKLDALGNKEWDKTIGGNGPDILYSLQQTKDGGYILGGFSGTDGGWSPFQSDKSEASKGRMDYWIVKLNAAGQKQWDKTIGGSDDDYLYSLQQTADGGYILGGNSYSNISGDKSQNSKGSSDYWAVKLNAVGTKEWDKTIGGVNNDYLLSLQQTVEGGYIVGGYSDSRASGDKSENSKSGIDSDYWVVKLNTAGSKEWDKTIGGSSYDALFSLQQTRDQGYILGGRSSSNASFDKSEAAKGWDDYWVVKLNAAGSKEWDKTLGGSGDEDLKSLQQTADGGYILGGVSSSDAGGDKSENENTKGGGDYWVIKLGADLIAATIKTNSVNNSLYCPGSTFSVSFNTSGAFPPEEKFKVQLSDATGSFASPVIIGDGSTSPILATVPSSIVPGKGYRVRVVSSASPVIIGADNGSDLIMNMIPSTPLITSSANCGSSYVTLTASGAPEGGSYRWYTSRTGMTAIPEATGATYTTPVLSASTTYYVSIVNNTCESAREPVTATIYSSPVVEVTTSANTVTAGSSTTLSASGALSYSWSPATGLSSATGAIVTASPASTTVYTVTGTSANGCSSSNSITITVNPIVVSEAIRINTGGAAFMASNNRPFMPDQYFGGTNGVSSLSGGDILNTTDDGLYRSERSSTGFTYSIPVQSGPVNVVLHFAEIWFGVPGRGTGGVGSRQFNVEIEGSRKLTNYDIFAKAGGALRAVQETLPVTVTDGVLNINFLSGAANKPKISAIEILPQTVLSNAAPELAAIGNRVIRVNQPLSFPATATDANEDQTKTFSLVGVPSSGAVINATSGVFTWTPTIVGTFTFTVRVTDNGSPILTDEEQFTITVQNNALAAIRLNSGGKAISTTVGSFSADAYLTGATEVSTKVVAIANTTADGLYQDYRKATSPLGSFGYSIPVANGAYTVKLHFAELYFTAKSKRLFHVTAEGVHWLTNYDIFAAAGGANRAIVVSKAVTVTDGKLEVVLTSVTDRASLAAIEVMPVVSGLRKAINDTQPEEVISLKASLYPNPVNEKVTIRLSEPVLQLQTTITDITGAVQGRDTHRMVDNTLLEIPVTSLSPAVYLLQIQTEWGWQTLKFIKK